jgi:hypothetical protein
VWDESIIISVILVPKILPRLNEDILCLIFSSLFTSYTQPYHMHRTARRLCLTCQQWRRLARRYLAVPKLLKLSFPDLKRVQEIDFVENMIHFSQYSYEKFTLKAWEKHHRFFFDRFYEISRCSVLNKIEFNGCFNTFRPSEWSRYLGHCHQLRRFAFTSEECAWDDIKDFLIGLQHSCQVDFDELVLLGISALRRQESKVVDATQVNKIVRVGHLKIFEVCFTDILSNVLPVIGSDLNRIFFYRTSFSIECARKLVDFLSSPSLKRLERVDCSLLPPDLNEYFLSAHPEGTLVWPQPTKPEGIFSLLHLAHFNFDGGIFGTTLITSQHILLFSQMSHLTFLRLKYCFNDVHPTVFSALANRNNSLWSSLKCLYVKFEFGDPNWERRDMNQLANSLRPTMEIEFDRPGYLTMFRSDEGEDPTLLLTFREGGDESYGGDDSLYDESDGEDANLHAVGRKYLRRMRRTGRI